MPAVLFTGHMIDRPDRAEPRFPPNRVPSVRLAVASVVASIDEVDAGAISGLACGGDLIFAEIWLATGRPLTAHLPRDREGFLDESVRFAGDEWVAAYERVVAHPLTAVVPATEQMIRSSNPHTANNERMLADAQSRPRPLYAVVVWNGAGGEPGGTADFIEQVINAGGTVTTIAP